MDFNYYLDPITNHYFDFEGVTARKPFWMFVLFNVLIGLALSIVLGIVHLGSLSGLYSLAVLLPSVGIAVRRMHDIGKSGWWLLASLIPILGAIYVIYLYCQPSSTPYSGAPAPAA
jgi:uncharacterized membrane protein YhaH (DUF805 family)